MKVHLFLAAVALCASNSLAAKLSGATNQVDAINEVDTTIEAVDDHQAYDDWWCDNGSGKKNCRWRGGAPFCDQPNTHQKLGDIIDGMILTDWTKNSPVWKLYDNGDITKDCRWNYGKGCSFGYKILLCKP